MKLGRPQQFDRETVLRRAIDVFWRRGYEASSVQDLLDAMGINRGSMYNSFGDKRSLFVEAVELYCSDERETASALLKRGGSPLDNVIDLVRGWGDRAAQAADLGCLVTNTAVELAPHVPEVADTLTYHISRLERMIRTTLDRAVDSGEVEPRTDTRALSRRLITLFHGLMVMGRAGASQEAITDVVESSIALLKRRQHL